MHKKASAIFLTLFLISNVPLPTRSLQSSISILSGGVIYYPLGGYGIAVGYLDQSGFDLSKPSIWALLKYARAEVISFGTDLNNKAFVDKVLAEANANGVKVVLYFGWNIPEWSTNLLFLSSIDETKTVIDDYGLERYADNPAIAGWILGNEPRPIDTKVIPTLKWAYAYVKTKVTQPVAAAALTPVYDGNPVANTKTWIENWIDYCDWLNFHLYLIEYFQNMATKDWKVLIADYIDNALIPATRGKRVEIGECGIWTGYLEAHAIKANFTQEDQDNYFKAYGEVTKPRDIPIIVYRLLDKPDASWGLFRLDVDGAIGMNIPKLSVPHLHDYLVGS